MNTSRRNFGVEAHGNYIYVVGVMNSRGYLSSSSVEHYYDGDNDNWTTLNATMNQSLAYLSAVTTVNDKIYLIGGKDDDYKAVVFDVNTE